MRWGACAAHPPCPRGALFQCRACTTRTRCQTSAGAVAWLGHCCRHRAPANTEQPLRMEGLGLCCLRLLWIQHQGLFLVLHPCWWQLQLSITPQRVRRNHLLRNAFCASRTVGDWSRNALQSNCVPSSQAQARKLLHPVPYLSSTMPGTETQQLKILLLQYQSVHSSLTGPNVLPITRSKKPVDLGSNSDCWTHHFPFPYHLDQTYNEEFAIIHNIPLFCAAEHCISSARVRTV